MTSTNIINANDTKTIVEDDTKNINININTDTNTIVHNMIIIGGGCAGYVAAYYSGRAGLKPILIEGTREFNYIPGGQLTITTDVENFPAFPEGIDGKEAVYKLKQQALKWDTIIWENTVTKCDFTCYPFKIFLDDNEKDPIFSKTIIIATGANAKKLNIIGEDIYWNNGISACATCDGALPIFRNKPICVVGGGDTAMEEAMFLSKFGSIVYLINRTSKFRASKTMLERVKKNKKIEIITDTIVIEAIGDKKLQKIKVKNLVSNTESYINTSGLFYAIGHSPNTDIFKNQINIDNDGYIITKDKSTCTNIAGVFACGDVQDKTYRQAVTAMGSGCSASIDATRFLENIDDE